MQKVEYGVKCRACGNMPKVREVVGRDNARLYFLSCTSCNQPLSHIQLRPSVDEARWDWKIANEQGYSQAKYDAAVRAVRFLLELDSDGGATVPNVRVIEAMQEMVDEHIYELFGAASTTILQMLKSRVLKQPPQLITPNVFQRQQRRQPRRIK